MQKFTLKARDTYLKRMVMFQDTEMIKVITGVRRCGKSSLMKLMVKHLLDTGIDYDQIFEMNFESIRFPNMDARGFYEYVKARILPEKRMYLFFDEVQRILGWENAVNSFCVDFDCDIYITGSNAYWLSSELSTYLSGRYVEIKMLPLSFKEFLDFHGYTVTIKESPTGTLMPNLADVGLEIDRVIAILDGVYSAAIVNDILEHENRRGQRTVTNVILLRKIIMFLANNIGSNVSATSISNMLVSEGLLEEKSRKKPAVHTIQRYIEALMEAYILYEVKRFDIKNREYLRTLGKYFIVDMGLRNYLLGYRDGDREKILENIVYLELLRQGYSVANGKIANHEVDFIATKMDEKKYIQVTENMNVPETRERKLVPLRKIRDHYEKIVIALDCDLTQTQDGIKVLKIIDFLL